MKRRMNSGCVALVLAGALALPVVAQAQSWSGIMNGASEVLPVNTTAMGFTSISILNHMMTVNMTWTGLLGGNPGAAHIHCCIAPGGSVGVAVGFPGFPSAMSGSYTNTFDLATTSTYTSGFISGFGGGTAAGSEAALIAGLTAGQAYSNIHNGAFPGGEIRGLLAPTVVPEPSTVALTGVGLFGLFAAARRRRRSAAPRA
jgi:hypothetical protein